MSTIRTIGVLGGKGMLGSDLVRFLGERYEVTSIDRDDYDRAKGSSFDVLVNANGQSRRFWANEHPAEDFELSTASVMRSLFDFRSKKYVYISSPDVYEDPSSPSTTQEDAPGDMHALSPYGFHKRLGEELVRHYASDFLIVRPAALLGTKLAKGIVYDVVHDIELYVTLESRMQFITTDAVAHVIATLLEKNTQNEVVNVGGAGVVTPAAIGVLTGKPVRVRSGAELQEYEINTEKIRGLYSALETSEAYVKMFLQTQH